MCLRKEDINNPNFNSMESHIIKNEEVQYNRFTMTPKRWKENNPEIANKGNIREYADLIHLVILNNLENINAELIEMKIPQSERLIILNNMAKKQWSY